MVAASWISQSPVDIVIYLPGRQIEHAWNSRRFPDLNSNSNKFYVFSAAWIRSVAHFAECAGIAGISTVDPPQADRNMPLGEGVMKLNIASNGARPGNRPSRYFSRKTRKWGILSHCNCRCRPADASRPALVPFSDAGWAAPERCHPLTRCRRSLTDLFFDHIGRSGEIRGQYS